MLILEKETANTKNKYKQNKLKEMRRKFKKRRDQ